MFAEFEPGRSLFGTIEFSPPVAEVPMSLAELRDSARRVLGVDLPFEEPKGQGPHALRRINGQNTRMRNITVTAGCCCSATPRTCTAPWAAPA